MAAAREHKRMAGQAHQVEQAPKQGHLQSVLGMRAFQQRTDANLEEGIACAGLVVPKHSIGNGSVRRTAPSGRAHRSIDGAAHSAARPIPASVDIGSCGCRQKPEQNAVRPPVRTSPSMVPWSNREER